MCKGFYVSSNPALFVRGPGNTLLNRIKVDYWPDLGHLSSGSQGVSQQNKRMRNVDTVMCPICNEAYPTSVIEEHAANCGDEVYV